MFKLTGTMQCTKTGSMYTVDEQLPLAAEAQGYLAAMQRVGYTADLTATVTTGAGSVTYKIIVE